MTALERPAATSLETYPLCLYAPQMATIFGLGLKRFYALASEGAFDWAENRPRIGRKSWSRVRVEQYFHGEIRGLTPVRRRSA
jgi:hypothetical protein